MQVVADFSYGFKRGYTLTALKENVREAQQNGQNPELCISAFGVTRLNGH